MAEDRQVAVLLEARVRRRARRDPQAIAVRFAASSAPGEVEAQVVAHTWGTEAVLEVAGLEPGRTYEVFFVDGEGREVSAGAFLGSKVTIDCQMNAAVMREDVTGLRIATDDGTTVREAELPAATA